MTALREKEIARRLAAVEVPPPPPDLLGRLKNDIPVLVPSHELGSPESPRSSSSRGIWLAAASVTVAVLGGFLALRVTDPVPRSTAPAPKATTTEAQAPYEAAPEVATAEGMGALGEASVSESPLSKTEAPAKLGQAGAGLRERGAVAYRGGAPQIVPEASVGTTHPSTVSKAAPVEVDKESVKEQRLQVSREEMGRALDEQSRRQPPPPAPSASLASPPQSARELPIPDPTPDSDLGAIATFEDKVEVQAESPVVNVTSAVAGQVISSSKREKGRERAAQKKLKNEIPKPAAVVAPWASTGGTAEPNDQPYGDVFFKHSGTNPFVDPEEDPLSTFGLDVDTGSYGVLRRYLTDDHLPPPEAVRVEEVVNAFDYGDQPPREGDFALYGEGAETPFADGSRYRLLRFALKGRVVNAAERKPALLVFVVDVSGSMDKGNRLGLVKKSLGLLLDELRSDDRVGLVVFGSQGEVLLEPTGDLERIRSAIDRVTPGGSTNAEEGLVLGYQQASKYFRRGGINRVILCSDGVANVGRTGAESLLKRIREEAERGIELTTLGFGMGNYNDVLMERLADEGDGRYAYLDTLAEARRVLVEDLTGTLQTIASEARAQVEFNPAAVERYRLLGYENRDIADERFRDDTVDAGEIGAGHGVTVLYEVKLAKKVQREAEIATLRLRYRSSATGQFEEVSRTVLARQVQGSWDEASPAFRLASLAAEMAEILKQTYWARGSNMGDVFRRAQALSPSFSGEERVAELASLAGKAARLVKAYEEKGE